MGDPVQQWSVAIDSDRKRITATWGSRVTDAGLSAYQTAVSLHPDHRGYDELLDFLAVVDVQVEAASLQGFATRGAARDASDPPSRIALVVGAALHVGLARMYAAYRGARPGNAREIGVFTELAPASAWLDAGRLLLAADP